MNGIPDALRGGRGLAAAPSVERVNESASHPVSVRAGPDCHTGFDLGHVGSGWAYHHPDAQGNVRQTTDSAGRITMSRSYTPFGAVKSQVGSAPGTFGYAGEQQDAASDLVFMRARYYDPSTGRFITRDPYPAYSGVPATLHRYAYVGNDPINRTDPSGLTWWDDVSEAVRWYVTPDDQARGTDCGPGGMMGRLWETPSAAAWAPTPSAGALARSTATRCGPLPCRPSRAGTLSS